MGSAMASNWRGDTKRGPGAATGNNSSALGKTLTATKADAVQLFYAVFSIIIGSLT